MKFIVLFCYVFCILQSMYMYPLGFVYVCVCGWVGVHMWHACMQWVCVVVTVVSYHVIFLQDLITDNSHAKYVYRVYCGHLYHQDCLNTYMKTPPFTGGWVWSVGVVMAAGSTAIDYLQYLKVMTSHVKAVQYHSCEFCFCRW